MFNRTTLGSLLMNKRKRVGPRIELCGTPVIIVNSGDDFPSKISLQPVRREQII